MDTVKQATKAYSANSPLGLLQSAISAIACQDERGLREWLAEHDPDGYYPNADKVSLYIHVARAASAQLYELQHPTQEVCNEQEYQAVGN